MRCVYLENGVEQEHIPPMGDQVFKGQVGEAKSFRRVIFVVPIVWIVFFRHAQKVDARRLFGNSGEIPNNTVY